MSFDTDVLVIGGGLSGYSTALSAAEGGADVLIVEKTAASGGSTILSGGSFAFAGTDMQRDRGIEDSPEKLKEDILSLGKHRNDKSLVDLYITHQLEVYHWLKELGVNFTSVSLSGGMSAARAHSPQISEAFDVLAERVNASPQIRVLWQAPAIRLLTESEAGPTSHGPRVRGAVVTVEGVQHEVLARYATVLASGGYTRSSTLRRAFAPASETAKPISGEGHQGDGTRLGMSVGAGLADVSEVRPTFGASAGGDYGPDKEIFLHPVYRGGIIVGPDGARFVDESLPYKDLGEAFLRSQHPVAFQIFDSSIMKQSISGKLNADYAHALALGHVLAADTIEDLASAISIEPHVLRASLDRYNANVMAGSDPDFGRSSLAGGIGETIVLDQPPYYAYPSKVVVAGTPGGLTVTTSMQVRNVFDEPIPGLFAVGEVVGGFHGAGYMSGTMLGKAAVFGRIAGRSVTGR